LRNPLKVAVGSRPRGVVIADFDGDGRPDLAVADSGTGKVQILLNDCSSAAGGARTSAGGPGGARGNDGDGEGAGDVSNTLPTGQWGGPHVRLDVTEKGATAEFDCAHGTIDERVVPGAGGSFSARGTFVGEHGGPSRDTNAVDESGRPAAPGKRANGQAARYGGRVEGDTLTLTVTLTDSGQVVGTFKLKRGSAGRLSKCL
jgi:hypothetical protein